jgi:methylthioribose-1-phosphate isomerase
MSIEMHSRRPSQRIVPIRWAEDRVVVVDQTALPLKYREVELASTEDIAVAIEQLVVRGAPLLGITAAYAVALASIEAEREAVPDDRRRTHVEHAIERLRATRPTARNLPYALSRMARTLAGNRTDPRHVLLAEAKRIHAEDLEASAAIASRAEQVLEQRGWVLTYCNTGALATGGGGTALALILEGYQRQLLEGVYVCETRPLLQGARLTAWELAQHSVPFEILCDNAVASLLADKRVTAILVGADRIALNGDVANKVGTQMLAILAHEYGVPFHVVAPCSTFDPVTMTGGEIPIEQRAASEVRCIGDVPVTSQEHRVYNPSFDVTESCWITSYVCDVGVFGPEELARSDVWS